MTYHGRYGVLYKEEPTDTKLQSTTYFPNFTHPATVDLTKCLPTSLQVCREELE
jgi:hypothetical protein